MFEPATLLFTGGDIVSVIFMISTVLIHKIEAPLGLYLTDNINHTVVYCAGATACGILTAVRVSMAIFLQNEANGVIPTLYRMQELSNIPPNVERKIKVAIGRLNHNPIQITGWGLFTLDKTFVLTVLGFLVTYLVLIGQLGNDEANQCFCSCTKV
ncbi:uncharacterized protein LOC129589293 isoform X1 [Paramacrobiotus metropolitanus]|uniref:uncharacterized protein LOC129589293 isoform X1 n=1 Tax=Paramacrobiotus metropolitanus TaxID=2943436 RepID=UPI002445D3D9|nr:uncharacterized protein LOC129589293 isoform X1 [Paramacrobiotus metropolitanus]